MDYIFILAKIIEVFQKCNIKSFPLDCEDVSKKLGCKLYRYSELSEPKRNSCLLVSNESMKIHNRIYYNDYIIPGRIRFSIMHELGHIVLDHGDYKNDELEAEANFFASNILAPRMAIHYSKCKNNVDVAKQFNMTYEAAQYAFDNYKLWHRRVVYHKMDLIDKAMYSQFYDESQKKFIYSIKHCTECDRKLYNSPLDKCNACINRGILDHKDAIDPYLNALENNWLYGGL